MFDPYDALVPVFVETKLPKRFMQIGSAIFFHLNGEPFLLTAAHVVDELRSGALLVPIEGGFAEIEGYIAHIDLLPEQSREDDSVDIAYYRLSSRFANALSRRFTMLPQDRSELIESALELRVCSASGYPVSKGKSKGNIYSSEIFSFRGLAAEMETYEKLGLLPGSSIVIHFHHKRAIDRDTGERFPTPGLRGISGGGIFAWPAGFEVSDDWSQPKLVGVVHTFLKNEGLIIGTTFLPIVTAIGLGQMKGFGGIR